MINCKSEGAGKKSEPTNLERWKALLNRRPGNAIVHADETGHY